MAMASPSVENEVMAEIGPKISSFDKAMSGVTCVNMIGEITVLSTDVFLE